MIRQDDRQQIRLRGKILFSIFSLSSIVASVGFAFVGLPAFALPIAVIATGIAASRNARMPAMSVFAAGILGTSASLASVSWDAYVRETAADAFLLTIRSENVSDPVPFRATVEKRYSNGAVLEILPDPSNGRKYGLKIHASSELPMPEVGATVSFSEISKKTGGGSEFEKSLEREGILPGFRIPDPVTESPPPWWRGIGNLHRDFFASVSDRLFPRKESGLARGVLFGDGSGISDTEAESYRNSGLSHLVVASGGNVAVVLLAVSAFFRRFPSVFRIPALLFSIGYYASLTGFGIPVVRAIVMAGAATVAQAFFRTDPLPCLLAAAAAFLWAEPGIGANASFLLSFSATFGIVCFSEGIEKRLAKVPAAFGFREILSGTVAATLATFPVTVGVFSSTSTLSIMSNVLAIPALALATVPTFLAGIAEISGHSAIATVFAAPGYLGWHWVNFVAETASSADFSVFSGFPTPFAAFVCGAGIGIVTAVSIRTNAVSS